jgi:hypothetical protein
MVKIGVGPMPGIPFSLDTRQDSSSGSLWVERPDRHLSGRQAEQQHSQGNPDPNTHVLSLRLKGTAFSSQTGTVIRNGLSRIIGRSEVSS